MARDYDIAIPHERYTRGDFAALKARLIKIQTASIMRLYYTEDSLDDIHCPTPEALERRLDKLRELLVQRVVLKNPAMAVHLDNARKYNSWPAAAVKYLTDAADQDISQAFLEDSISAWFKPKVAMVLREDGLRSLASLKKCIETRGVGWYRPIQRLGAKRAESIQNWIRKQPNLGVLTIPTDKPVNHPVQLTLAGALAPLERIGSISIDLSGVEGANRSQHFCLVSARNDLEAVQAYLYKFRGQDKTLRAYRKELERFLLWCVVDRRKALSSTLTDDCESYKDFLAQIPPNWIGTWAPRHSERWKPFVGQLAHISQRYAVQVVRSCFEWLVKVRYLGGNPWVTVADPAVAIKENLIDIDKAVPIELWGQLAADGGLLDQVCKQEDALNGSDVGSRDSRVEGAQYRLARAAILLMGYTGLRREEVARAQRHYLRRVPEQPTPELWELRILGKRNRWRTVFMPGRVIQALKVHWLDRGHDFLDSKSEMALISPVIISMVPCAITKHWVDSDAGRALSGAGFLPDSLYQVVSRTLKLMAKNEQLDLTEDQRAALLRAAPHAFRHTFGTKAASKDMPMDVLQRLMGHASMQTTSIYVQAERARSISEVGKFFSE